MFDNCLLTRRKMERQETQADSTFPGMACAKLQYIYIYTDH